MKKAMEAMKKAPRMTRIKDKGVFYVEGKKKGWAGKRLWVAGDTTIDGGRWFAKWRWDGWIREPRNSPYAPKKTRKAMSAMKAKMTMKTMKMAQQIKTMEAMKAMKKMP